MKKKSRRFSHHEILLSKSIIKRQPYQKHLQWSEQAVLDAMKAVQERLPVRTAARVHGVPKLTLHDRIKGKVVHGVKPGPKQYLSAEEERELAQFAIESASVGYGQTIQQITTIAENVAKDKGILRKDTISQGWYKKFLKRQSYLSLHRGILLQIIGWMQLHHKLLNNTLIY